MDGHDSPSPPQACRSSFYRYRRVVVGVVVMFSASPAVIWGGG